MSVWEAVRQEARHLHAQAVVRGRGRTASALLNGAAAVTGVACEQVPRGDALLCGALALYDADCPIIWYQRGASAALTALYRAHEYAHVRLDGARTACGPYEVEGELAREPALGSTQRVEGYGPAELRERRANVFAREFLLPAALARELYEQGATIRTIERRTGVPLDVVCEQLSAGLLLPDPPATPSAIPAEPAALTLDPSQQDAAEAERGPLLLEAGPGTGKTRTLVARILHLLGRAVPPEQILALTFSIRAAEEMRTRIAASAPDAANRLWIGTFHAFGLDLLRKRYAEAGLPPRFAVLDPPEALALLERGLPELGLDYYRDLVDPARYLADILRAISRAKDELVGPGRYAALAGAMLARASEESLLAAEPADGADPQDSKTVQERAAKRLLDAERAQEVARVYAWYEAALTQRGAVDFGDLIARSYALLHEHAGVREAVQSEYRQVLVDEYQDVNRASGLLLREVAGDGAGLWVVGDPRQAIYRFRGASPANLRLFAEDFPGAQRRALGRNYRSRPAVLGAVAGFAATMPTPDGAPFGAWKSAREAGAGGSAGVALTVAADREHEGAAIAREVERLRAAGIPYREQAVLCRSHATLARTATLLEAAGVPVFYLGDLFERPEVRDLLALLQLLAGEGEGLLRVAAFPEYNVPQADVLTLLQLAAEEGAAFPAALWLAIDAPAISTAGRSALTVLARQLDGLADAEPWVALTRYLFERSRYLRVLLDDCSPAAQQQRIALYQLLEFARGHGQRAPRGDAGPAALLRRVRRLEMYGDERQLRQLPDRAAGLDAVRLLTVHASKGLEFGAVHLPGLAAGAFPAAKRWDPCPPPDGLSDTPAHTARDAEEECLFFVALSRARDALSLSRPANSNGRKSNPSPLLARLEPYFTDRHAASSVASAVVTPPGQISDTAVFDLAELDLYQRCPRQYYYERVLGLAQDGEDNAYRRFNRVVRGTLRWMQGALARGEAVGPELLDAKLDELWRDVGPAGHPYEAEYRARAVEILGVARRRADRAAWTDRPHWEVALPHGTVRLRPDNVEERPDGSLALQRLRPGKVRAAESDEPVYGLYHAAAPDAEIETVFLGDGGATVPVVLTERQLESRRAKYDAAMAGIQHGRFDPQQDERRCPRCPHYFVCPAGAPIGSGTVPPVVPLAD